MVFLVNLIEVCKPFCDFNMRSEIFIPESIYGDFNKNMNSIMVLLAMSDYVCVYNSSKHYGEEIKSSRIHYFKFMKEGQRFFTITINNNIDKYHSMLDVSISYHCYHNQTLHEQYANLFDVVFEGLGTRDDNLIIFETETNLIEGLKRFANIT